MRRKVYGVCRTQLGIDIPKSFNRNRRCFVCFLRLAKSAVAYVE